MRGGRRFPARATASRKSGLLEQRYERCPQHLGRGYPLGRLAHVRPFFSVEIEQS